MAEEKKSDESKIRLEPAAVDGYTKVVLTVIALTLVVMVI
jgi:hypothetical protein